MKSQSPRVLEPGNWIIFTVRLGIGDNLAKLLEMQGESCKVIHGSQEDGISQSDQILLSPANPESRF
ncbi:MAG: hypothetical protein AAFW70_28420 [Cyanobacteria bacterium J06635_10]